MLSKFRLFSILLLTCLGAEAKAQEGVNSPSKNTSATDKYRVCWNADPTTKATIAWNQQSGKPGKVYFDMKDHGRDLSKYAESQKIDRVQKYDGMKNCFVRLSGLKPDTPYYFCIEDEMGISRRLSFHTAPAEPKPFTFIAGGDSRNFKDVRIAANMTCEKLRPLFIAFTGDMINKDEAPEWVEWLDDWQQVISKDGHVIPIVAHRGNHERRPETIHHHFDTPLDAFFAFSIGGELFRYYTLNSEIPATGAQEAWLDRDLTAHSKKTMHLVAGYHKPMRPHVSAKKEGDNPMAWADNFYKYGVDLSIESDSHVMKRTHPLKPDANGHEGFSESFNDPKATVYIGEGCWGAPLRAADDGKPWTSDAASFNGIDWIQVSKDDIKVKTIKITNTARIEPARTLSNFEDPKGITLWEAKGGTVLTIPADR
ncbi:MAG: purple acid phosphatase family protein [Verrucomicrobiales bacterium]